MPTYTFTSSDGTRIERFMLIAEYERRVKDGILIENGVRYERDLVADLPGGQGCNTWPMKSVAAGVHPSQIDEYTAAGRAAGVDVQFTPDGDAVFHDRAHRRQCLKHWGMIDKDGGYGDG